MDRWIDGWIDGWMDGWMDMDLHTFTYYINIKNILYNV
jgi:hypothetical protein